MKIKQLEWSEERQPNVVYQTPHILALTSIGEIVITWRTKGSMTEYIAEFPWGRLGITFFSIQRVKDEAQRILEKRIKECLE